MSLEEYRTLFLAGSLVVGLVAAAPTLGLVVPFARSGEGVSELWLLGPNHMAEDYPFEITVNEQYRVFLGVGNHMGCSEYYAVYVKFRNQTELLPDVSNSAPSSLPSVYEFRFLVVDGEVWESLLTFEFLDVSVEGDSAVVASIAMNGVACSVDSVSTWDAEHDGFYYQLFFELWLYNRTSQDFHYHDRFVGIWLKLSAS